MNGITLLILGGLFAIIVILTEDINKIRTDIIRDIDRRIRGDR